MKNLLNNAWNSAYKAGVQSVFETFMDEIEDWDGLHKKNAEYLINLVKQTYAEYLEE